MLPGIGHTGTFFAVQPEASSRLINTFFDTGKVDDSLYQPQTVDFTPANSFGKIAKVFLGLALALATLTVLSLLWMAWWVHKRGRLRQQGKRGAPVAVPDHPRPGRLAPRHVDRPRDDAQRSDRQRPGGRLSVGVPVGLGVYLAWVHRDWSAQRKGVGLAAAIAGALAGAWLGFHATTGLIALVTAILAAVAGANLVVILLDMARASSADDRISADRAPDTRSASAKPETPAGAGVR